MKKFCILLTILSFSQFTRGQAFSFPMYFEDSIGNKDTIVLGYDISGTDSIDNIFGEVNIISIPLDTGLDVRITDEWSRRQYPYYSNGTFHTKKQICYYNCPPLPSHAQVIDIYTKNWPVTASWDSLPFFTPCRNGSVFTQVMPGLWFDCVSGQSNFLNVAFKNKSQLTFTSNTGHPYFDENGGYLNSHGDTVSVFWLAFGDSTLLYAGIYERENPLLINIFPNPTTNNLTIQRNEKSEIEILNIEGQIIKKINNADKQTSIDVSDLSGGVYIIKAKTERGVAVKKFIKE